MTTPAAVTFDFWDTLLRAPGAAQARAGRRERLVPLFARLGLSVGAADLDSALAAARRRYDEGWVANVPFGFDDAIDGLLADLGVTIDAESRALVVDAFIGAASGDVPAPTAHIGEVLDALADAGVRLGIVCDVGLVPSTVLRDYLTHHGLLERFAHWSFSDEVGVYKPDPKIFAHALGGLGVDDPADALHVGDLRRTDVAGARAFGMTSVRYAGSNDDQSVVEVPAEGDRAALGSSGVVPADRVEADHVIHDHRELLTIVGLA